MKAKRSLRRESFSKYLTYSSEDETWGMMCTDAGYTVVPPKTLYPPHKDSHPRAFQHVAVGRTLNEYQMIYVTEGQGILETLGTQYAIVPGTLLLVFPGIRHFYKPLYEIGWVEYWTGFRGNHFDTLVRQGFLSPSKPMFAIGLQDTILESFLDIMTEVKEQKPLYQLKASTKILGIIAETLAIERRNAQPNLSEKLVQRAKFLMEENICRDIDLNSIAEALHVSTSYLNNVFKTYTAMTPYQYYIHIKVHMAKMLLEQADMSVKEVAFTMGFQDQYHFSRLFKSKTGMPPSRWMRQFCMDKESQARYTDNDQ